MVPVDRSIHSWVLGGLAFWAPAARLSRHRPAASAVERRNMREGCKGRREVIVFS